MITLLAKIFIKNYKDTENIEVRRKWGILSAGLGIFFDLLLGCGKAIVGALSNSVAILADGFNNITDSFSAIISLFGFKLSGQKADKEHPFGHGRFEYISGLLVSVVIIVMSVELFRESLNKVFHPEIPDFSFLAIGTMTVSILAKLYMFYYNTRLSKKLNSVTLKTVAKDSISDCVAMFFIIITALIYNIFGLNLDGYMGLAVSCIIFYTGFTAAKETMTPLLGQPPSKDFVKKVREIVLSHPDILDMHDLMVHDYGPGRLIISLHAEVPAKGDILELHDVIDNTELELHEKLLCQATIHMDPVENDNPEVNRLKNLLETYVKNTDIGLNFHDFRVVDGPTHTNLIFDLVVPYNCQMKDSEIHEFIIGFAKKMSAEENKKYYVKETIERGFI